jgi:hypothetical protein
MTAGDDEAEKLRVGRWPAPSIDKIENSLP